VATRPRARGPRGARVGRRGAPGRARARGARASVRGRRGARARGRDRREVADAGRGARGARGEGPRAGRGVRDAGADAAGGRAPGAGGARGGRRAGGRGDRGPGAGLGVEAREAACAALFRAYFAAERVTLRRGRVARASAGWAALVAKTYGASHVAVELEQATREDVSAASTRCRPRRWGSRRSTSSRCSTRPSLEGRRRRRRRPRARRRSPRRSTRWSRGFSVPSAVFSIEASGPHGGARDRSWLGVAVQARRSSGRARRRVRTPPLGSIRARRPSSRWRCSRP
jgi:hypothetical protein